METVVIAHRGASFLAEHENTLEAFQLAIDIGAEYVEFDIRMTKDKKLIVFHNASINDTPISDLTYKALCERTAASGYTVPLLADVLKLCHGKIKLDIELKETGYEDKIIFMVTREYSYSYDMFMMKSFLDTSVAQIKSIDSNITAGLLLGYETGDIKRRFNEYFPERRIRACKADFVSPNFRLATPFFIRRMHILKKNVYVWTVNDTKAIDKFINRDVDGIITDKPDAAIFIRKRFSI